MFGFITKIRQEYKKGREEFLKEERDEESEEHHEEDEDTDSDHEAAEKVFLRHNLSQTCLNLNQTWHNFIHRRNASKKSFTTTLWKDAYSRILALD